MKMLTRVLFVVAVASVFVSVTEQSEDEGPPFSCPLDDSGECASPYCRKIPGRGCRTDHRDCLVPDAMDLDITRKNCVGRGKVWCRNYQGGSGKCVMAEPTRRSCFRPKHHLNAMSEFTSEESCNEAGHLWCDAYVREENREQCFVLPEPIFPSGSKCDDGEHSCCKSRICIPIPAGEVEDDLRQKCTDKGCKMCGAPGKERCVYGKIPGTSEGECPAFNYDLEDCYATLKETPNEGDCKNMGCKWCSQRDYSFYCVRDHPMDCDVDDKPACKNADADSYDKCKLWGCEWCGDAHCQESTQCTACSCPERVRCNAATKDACERLKCKWCENATDFKCMNVNSEGMYRKGEWTECTKTCGCGTQWQYDPSCEESNPLNCERVYRSCNTEDCPGTCSTVEIARHESTEKCCADHTWQCGRNTLNQVQADETPKMALMGGSDIESIKKWPWLALVYTATEKCGGTLISNQHILTSRRCLGDAATADIMVNLDTYDRSLEPGIELGAMAVVHHKELSIVTLKIPFQSFAECVAPLCLPRNEPLKQDMKCFIAGWGQTDPSNPACVAKAQDAEVKILPQGMCEQGVSMESSGNLFEEFNMRDYFCAGFPEGGSDPCPGDAGDIGGPLMCQRCTNCGWYLAGVTMLGSACDVPGKPMVYARVSSYEDWIERVVPPVDTNTYQCPESD